MITVKVENLLDVMLDVILENGLVVLVKSTEKEPLSAKLKGAYLAIVTLIIIDPRLTKEVLSLRNVVFSAKRFRLTLQVIVIIPLTGRPLTR